MVHQDVVGRETGCGPEDVAKGLGLHALRGRQWFCQGCSAVSGQGIYEGLDWITNELKNHP